MFGEFQLMSEEATQQGDPLGPLLYCLAVQHLWNSLNSSFAASYMDDFTVGGTETDVERDVQHITQAGADIGLNVNTYKSEIIHDARHTLSSGALQSFPPPQEACLLGCPLVEGPALDIYLQTLLQYPITGHHSSEGYLQPRRFGPATSLIQFSKIAVPSPRYSM